MALSRNYKNKESEATSIYILDRASQGASMQQIADELGMSVSAVQSRYRKEAKIQLSKMANIVAEIKLLQTQQLGYIYNQAIASWQISAKIDDNGMPTREGDTKYLDAAMRSLKDVRQIWQADKPIEITPEGAAFPQDDTASLLGGNINQMEDVMLILQELGELPAEVDMEQVSEHLIPIESTANLDDNDLPDEIV